MMMKRSFVVACALALFTPAIAHAQAQVVPPESSTTTQPQQQQPPQQPAPTPLVVGPPSETPNAPTLPKKKKATPVGLRIDGGYSFRKLVQLPLKGADIGVALGAQPTPWAAYWGVTRLFLGSTENGLSVYTWRLGADFDLIPFDRLRIMPGINFFLVGVERAVRDDTITAWGPAAHLGLRVDIVQTDGFALFGRADIDAGYEFYNSTVYWGPTLGAGVDFDLHGDRSSFKENANANAAKLRRGPRLIAR